LTRNACERTNLVEATRLRQEPKKLLTLDYALGSAFECSACLDVAVLKGLLDAATSVEEKQWLRSPSGGAEHYIVNVVVNYLDKLPRAPTSTNEI